MVIFVLKSIKIKLEKRETHRYSRDRVSGFLAQEVAAAIESEKLKGNERQKPASREISQLSHDVVGFLREENGGYVFRRSPNPKPKKKIE